MFSLEMWSGVQSIPNCFKNLKKMYDWKSGIKKVQTNVCLILWFVRRGNLVNNCMY